MERVVIYLRKSRSDIESEADGIDTLDKHRRTLLKFAKERELNIIHIYEEVASGESLLYRPEMQNLLKAVQNGLYQAVLVMDMDRLGRGNMQEQGLIIDTFRESNTKIITPRKTYDLRDEFDEEYSEFEAFMARKELKIITRRLQSGRIRSVQDGNFNATFAPFGYTVVKVDNRTRTLVIKEDEAEVVRFIFKLYTESSLGMKRIATQLNEIGFTFKGSPFRDWNVNQILKNIHYIGMVVFNKRKSKPSTEPGKKRTSKKRAEEDIVYADGKHEPIVSKEIFDRAAQKMKLKESPSLKQRVDLRNPLSGILKCGYCGRTMTRNVVSRNKVFIRCVQHCDNNGTRLERVESEVIKHMQEWMESHKIKLKIKKEITFEVEKKAVQLAIKECNELKRQKDNLHDLLERGVYSIEMYLERSKQLADRIAEKETITSVMQQEIERKEEEQKTRKEFIPALINVMNLYHKAKTVEQKNKLLKSVLHKAVYTKENDKKNGFFEIALYPKLPGVKPL
jgi:hypothetical protein